MEIIASRMRMYLTTEGIFKSQIKKDILNMHCELRMSFPLFPPYVSLYDLWQPVSRFSLTYWELSLAKIQVIKKMCHFETKYSTVEYSG